MIILGYIKLDNKPWKCWFGYIRPILTSSIQLDIGNSELPSSKARRKGEAERLLLSHQHIATD